MRRTVRGFRYGPAARGCTTLRQAAPDFARLFPKRLGNPEEYAMVALTMIECGYFNGEDVRVDGAIRMSPR